MKLLKDFAYAVLLVAGVTVLLVSASTVAGVLIGFAINGAKFVVRP